MNKIEQNLSALNENWKKNLKKLANIIKPFNLLYLLIAQSSLNKIENNVLFINTSNDVVNELIQKYKRDILLILNKDDLFKEVKEIQCIGQTNTQIKQKTKTNKKQVLQTKKISNVNKLQNDSLSLSYIEEYKWNYFETQNYIIPTIKEFIKNQHEKFLVIKGSENAGKSFLINEIANYCNHEQIICLKHDYTTINYLIEEIKVKDNVLFLVDNVDLTKNNKLIELIDYLKTNNSNKFIFALKEEVNFLSIFFNDITIDNRQLKLLLLPSINKNIVDMIIKNRINFYIYPQSYSQIVDCLWNDPKKIYKFLQVVNIYNEQSTRNLVDKTDIDNILLMLNVNNSSIDVDKVINTVAKKLDLDVYDIKSPSRKKEYVVARAIITYILRNIFNFSYEKIGFYLNRSSHSTIINLIKFYQHNLVDNYETKQIINIFNIDNKY